MEIPFEERKRLFDGLDPLEKRVAIGICRGKEIDVIAEDAKYSKSNTRTILTRIYDKLKIEEPPDFTGDKRYGKRNELIRLYGEIIGIEGQEEPIPAPDLFKPKQNPKTTNQPPTITRQAPPPRIPRNIQITILLGGIFVAFICCCWAIGFVGREFQEWQDRPTNTPTDTPTSTLTPSTTPTHTSTPSFTPTITNTPTDTLTPTITPTRTITPTKTNTKTSTPTRTPTPMPEFYFKGQTISDGRVSLAMNSYEFNPDVYTTSLDFEGAIKYSFTFTNRSAITMLLRFDESQFSLFDNNGRNYPECVLSGGTHYYDAFSVQLDANEKLNFNLWCGKNIYFDNEVTYAVLNVTELSTIPDHKWKVEVPK